MLPLDKWIAIIFLVICCAYGYTAWFLMDAQLPPFMLRNPVYPSSMPKMLAILGIVLSIFVLFGRSDPQQLEDMEIDYRRLGDYKIGQAIGIVVLMALYAFALRPLGFIFSTTAFLVIGPWILGERKIIVMLAVGLITSGLVWYLVQQVLGIFLVPWPAFI